MPNSNFMAKSWLACWEDIAGLYASSFILSYLFHFTVHSISNICCCTNTIGNTNYGIEFTQHHATPLGYNYPRNAFFLAPTHVRHETLLLSAFTSILPTITYLPRPIFKGSIACCFCTQIWIWCIKQSCCAISCKHISSAAEAANIEIKAVIFIN